MTDYTWFPVTGDGETEATAYTWNVGPIDFNIGSFWANADAQPEFPITTGTVPGATNVLGQATDSAYIFAGQASGFLVDSLYTPDPAHGDPFIAKGGDGNYDFSTDIVLSSGSVAVQTLALEEVNVGGAFVPTLDIEGATVDVQGTLLSTFDPTKFPANLGTFISEASGFGIPQAGGSIVVGGGGTLEVSGSIAQSIEIGFGTGSGNIFSTDLLKTDVLSAGGTYFVGATITNFGAGDTIDLAGITDALVQSVTYDPVAATLDIRLADPGDIIIPLSGPGAAGAFAALDSSGLGTAIVACYGAGTRIATPRGEVPIEALREGDLVRTAAGADKPIVWIGHSRVDCRTHPKPEEVIPVRVRAGAFGPAQPARDLVLSPGHAVFAEGVLIPVGRLVNGVSILREEQTAEVTYYHLELAEHDVLLAEGLPAESYLDDGNRTSFESGAERVLRPDYMPSNWDNACAPMREGGPEVAAVKQRLRARLAEQGYRLRTEPEIELWAGGIRLTPKYSRGGLHHFVVPARARELRLVSPHGVPSGFDHNSADNRWLGAQLALVLLDGEWIPLDGPVLGEGFHGVEHDGSGRWRWTDGEARLHLPPASKPRLLELFVRDIMQSWIAPSAAAEDVA